MAHISKETLGAEQYKKLFLQLATVLSRAKVKETQHIFNDLLTETERIMLSKRCAAVLMLEGGRSQYVIHKTLKLSPSTVLRIARLHDRGQYTDMLHILNSHKKNREDFWKLIEVLIRGGMPSRGKARWQHLPKVN